MNYIDKIIEILQAAKEGKETQRRKLGTQVWEDNRGWDFEGYDFRVKPQPREWTIALDTGGSRPYPEDWFIKGEAWEKVKVREVL